MSKFNGITKKGINYIYCLKILKFETTSNLSFQNIEKMKNKFNLLIDEMKNKLQKEKERDLNFCKEGPGKF